MSVTPVIRRRVFAGRALDDRERRTEAAREDVGLDPVRAAALPLVGRVRKRDRLEAQPPTGPQHAIADTEERVEVLGPDRFEHLDRDDRVVRALHVAVVAQLDVDEVVESGGPDALARKLELLARDRHRGDPAAELAGGVQGEATPASPDLEDVLARLAGRRWRPSFGTWFAGHRRGPGPASSKTALE